MGKLVASALPVLPGQVERVRNFGQEVGRFQEEWERLNREGTFTKYSVLLQEGPQGALAIHVWEIEDPTRARAAMTDSEYDNWWQDYLRDVHGIDLRSLPAVPPPPPVVFEWSAAG
jgi:L-rhamnose mutarotase